ncbi:protein MRG2-like [Daucus carota subsp. sativus]|uniref:protein MRG2-like n=1 Tax=Daucus carota subsp. sativus TaxID=79200 RepID=UPI003082D1ED
MEVGGSNTGVTLMNCSSDRCLYQEGEKVLASYGGKWYEAKVQKVESTRTKGCLHFVHYPGWNKKWDEWLQAERLKKFTEETVPNQSKECGESARARNRKCGIKNKEKQSTDISQTEKNINIEIPPTLKKQLVDDFEFVTRLGQLVNLPRTPNVSDILNKYSAFRVKKDNGLNEEMEEFSRGLCGYFDKALPAMLLYDSERKQYQALSEEHKPPSGVYGAEHLLRLFVKLPEILEPVKIEEETLIKLQHEIQFLLKFLRKNQSKFFLSTYQRIPEHSESQNRE